MSFGPDGKPILDVCETAGCGRRTHGPKFKLCGRCYSRNHGLHIDLLARKYRELKLAKQPNETPKEHIARCRKALRAAAARFDGRQAEVQRTANGR